MRIKVSTSTRFSLIQEALKQDDNVLNISKLCEIAGVSRTGYYTWLRAADKRAERDKKDQEDFEIILIAFRYRGYAKGARGIYMYLLHHGTRMNLKKIRRLMDKYGLRCPIRKANPYRRMAKAIKSSTIAPNVVNRNFTEYGPRTVLLTDITYIFYSGNKCYLSTALDAYTHEVLAYEMSESLQIDFVLNTVRKLIQDHGMYLDDNVIVHSDQGCHYTSKAFIEIIQTEGFVQSMSRRGNCWDNAPQESFFGHMKDEISYYVAKCKRFDDVRYRVRDWMDYYNNERYQWDLLKLAPTQYYEYCTTGYYPLETYESKSRGAAPDPEV